MIRTVSTSLVALCLIAGRVDRLRRPMHRRPTLRNCANSLWIAA